MQDSLHASHHYSLDAGLSSARANATARGFILYGGNSDINVYTTSPWDVYVHTVGLRHRSTTPTTCMMPAAKGPADSKSTVPTIQNPTSEDYTRINLHY